MKRREQPQICSNCEPVLEEALLKCRSLTAQLNMVQSNCDEWEKHSKHWKSMYKNLGQDQGFEHDTVPSQYPLPEELRHSSFKPYLENLKKLIPLIATILLIFTSKTYTIKLHAKATNPKWILWSYFYRS